MAPNVTIVRNLAADALVFSFKVCDKVYTYYISRFADIDDRTKSNLPANILFQQQPLFCTKITCSTVCELLHKLTIVHYFLT